MEVPTTIAEQVVNEIIIERSRFICTLMPVGSAEQAQEMLAGLKKTYWDATHNCSAYIVGKRFEVQRYNDDGEPSGTAGVPMLEVLKKNNMYNILAVVTRYFGGVKLGAGGLVRAYSKAVSQAVSVAQLVEQRAVSVNTFTISHSVFARIQSQLDASDLIFQYQITYGVEIELHCFIEVDKVSEAELWLSKVCNQAIHLQFVEQREIDIPIEKGLIR